MASVIKGRRGGVISELAGEYKKNPTTNTHQHIIGDDHMGRIFSRSKSRDLPERNRLRVADLGVGGGGRIWLLTAMLVRKAEK